MVDSYNGGAILALLGCSVSFWLLDTALWTSLVQVRSEACYISAFSFMSPLIGLPIFLCIFFWNMKMVTAAFEYGTSRRKQITLCLLGFPIGWLVLLGELANNLIDKLISKL